MQTKTEQSAPPSIPIVTLRLKGRLATTIDCDDYTELSRYRWTAHKSNSRWYAVRKLSIDGKKRIIFMHRHLLNAPPELDVHHINGDSLDNRRSNLVLLSPAHHHLAHSVRRISKLNQHDRNVTQNFLASRGITTLCPHFPGTPAG